MKKTLVKIIGITIAFVLIFQNISVFAFKEKEQLEKEQSKIDDQIEDVKKKQDELEAKKSATMKEVENLIGQISAAEDEVEDLQRKVNDLKTQIEQKEKDIQEKQKEYTKQEELLDARLIAIYEYGETSYLDVLLTSSSMTDFLAKYNAASELIEYDKEMMQETKDQKAQIEKEKSELEANKKELDASKADKEAKSNQLKSLKKDKDAQAAKLNAEEKELQKEIEELEAENRKIANEIREAEIRYQKQLEELEKENGGNKPAGSGFFIQPVKSGPITARAYYSSGQFHGALDYGVSTGTTVYAGATGVVMKTANLSSSYGTYVVIRHANGLQSYYAHGTPGSIVVKPGDTVKQGQKIMLSGNSGHSSGPHLHFEVRKSPYNYSSGAKAYGQDSRVNPQNYL